MNYRQVLHRSCALFEANEAMFDTLQSHFIDHGVAIVPRAKCDIHKELFQNVSNSSHITHPIK